MEPRLLRFFLVGTLLILFILSLGWFINANMQAGMDLAEVTSSALLLAVPLALLYFSIGLLVEAWQQHRGGKMSERMVKFLYRTPRIAGIIIAVFTGLFALDVFAMEGSVWEKLGGFLIHALPSIMMLVMLALAWRHEWIGTLFFGLMALFFMRFFLADPMLGFGNLLLFALPMALVAALFWLNWRWRGELRHV